MQCIQYNCNAIPIPYNKMRCNAIQNKTIAIHFNTIPYNKRIEMLCNCIVAALVLLLPLKISDAVFDNVLPTPSLCHKPSLISVYSKVGYTSHFQTKGLTISII